MKCKKCGSENINVQAVSDVKGKTKGFSCIKSFIGMIFVPFIGFFCGMCGMGKGKTWTEIKSVKVCQDCGTTN